MMLRKHKQKVGTSFLILIGLFCLFQILEQGAILKEVRSFFHTQKPGNALIYFGTYLAGIISIFILVFHKNLLIRCILPFLLFISIAIDIGYRQLNGQGLTYEDALLLVQNIGFNLEGELLKTYGVSLFYAISISGITLAMIYFTRYFVKSLRFQKRRLLIIPLLSFLMTGYIMYFSNANRLAYPIPYKIPALLAYVNQKGLYTGPRKNVFFKPSQKPLVKHIIWIVDESVRGDLLQLNGFPKATTPFLYSKKDSIINMGVASSGSVCSDYSHILMMSGVRKNELPDHNCLTRKQATVFQYANLAGMQSNLLYVPGFKDEPKGYMTQNDWEHIENKIHTRKLFPDMEPRFIDHQSIDLLEEIIHSQEQSFTYFLKYGCHFHYESTYPGEERFFEPVQDSDSWDRDDPKPLRNSYYNSLRWQVDHFFKKLYERFKGEDILIIYTSDHGQHLMEYPDIKLTHCLKEKAPKEMAAVPLFIFPMNRRIYSNLDTLINNENYNLASHFNILPTTLELMGYHRDSIAQYYEPGLGNKLSPEEQIFISGDIFGRSEMHKNAFE